VGNAAQLTRDGRIKMYSNVAFTLWYRPADVPPDLCPVSVDASGVVSGVCPALGPPDATRDTTPELRPD
jgi:hypothetical protein